MFVTSIVSLGNVSAANAKSFIVPADLNPSTIMLFFLIDAFLRLRVDPSWPVGVVLMPVGGC